MFYSDGLYDKTIVVLSYFYEIPVILKMLPHRHIGGYYDGMEWNMVINDRVSGQYRWNVMWRRYPLGCYMIR